jgi:hypothetical protein
MEIGVENEALVVEPLEEDDSYRRLSIVLDRRQ